jgi:ribosomal protein L12E/L44/L45/RPP1/RPP2
MLRGDNRSSELIYLLLKLFNYRRRAAHTAAHRVTANGERRGRKNDKKNGKEKKEEKGEDREKKMKLFSREFSPNTANEP